MDARSKVAIVTGAGTGIGRAVAIGLLEADYAVVLAGRRPSGVLQASGQMAAEPRLDVSHVVRAVLYMASLPLDANVRFMTVMATTMPFIGRG